MNDPLKLKQLNRIVGETLLDLAQSGVDPEFLAEFAAKHRVKVAAALEVTSEVGLHSGLKGMIKETLIEALTELKIEPKKKAGRPKDEHEAQRVTVEVAGRRTTVRIRPTLWLRVVEISGSENDAIAVIKQIAARCPGNEANKSGWVAAQLTESLDTAKSHSSNV